MGRCERIPSAGARENIVRVRRQVHSRLNLLRSEDIDRRAGLAAERSRFRREDDRDHDGARRCEAETLKEAPEH
jgi:hypothetical protein